VLNPVVMAFMAILQLKSVNHAPALVLLAHPLLLVAPVVEHIILFQALLAPPTLAHHTRVLLVPLHLLLVILFIIYLGQLVVLLLHRLVLFIFLIILILTIVYTLNANLSAQVVPVVQVFAPAASMDMI